LDQSKSLIIKSYCGKKHKNSKIDYLRSRFQKEKAAMKGRFILILVMLLTIQKATKGKQNFNFMNEEDMLHLGKIFKQIDRLNNLNVVQVRPLSFNSVRGSNT